MHRASLCASTKNYLAQNVNSAKIRNSGIISIMAFCLSLVSCRGSYRYYGVVHNPRGTGRMSRKVQRCYRMMSRGRRRNNSLRAIGRHLEGVGKRVSWWIPVCRLWWVQVFLDSKHSTWATLLVELYIWNGAVQEWSLLLLRFWAAVVGRL